MDEPSGSVAQSQVVHVVELGSEDLELEHLREMEIEMNKELELPTVEASGKGKGKLVLAEATTALDLAATPELESPTIEPSYEALKLALSLSEGQLQNKRRRMSCIDEETPSEAKSQNQQHIGYQLATGHQGHSTAQEAVDQSQYTPIYDEFSHKDPASAPALVAQSANLGVKQAQPTSPLQTRPLIPSPLRNGMSLDEQEPVLTPMPDLHEELSPGIQARRFFKRRSLRPASREPQVKKTKEKKKSIIPTGAASEESPTESQNGNDKASPISTFLAEAAKRSGELKRRVSGSKAKKPALTRMEIQEGMDRAQRVQTADSSSPGQQGRESPTAILAAMLAVGATATATALPVSTLQEHGVVDQQRGQILHQTGLEANETKTVTTPSKAESASPFFKRKSLRSKPTRISPSIPTKKNPTCLQSEEPAIIPSPVSSNTATNSNTEAAVSPTTIENLDTALGAQSPLEPKPRTHVHFSRKRQGSDCTLCTPEYLLPGSVPDLSSESPSPAQAPASTSEIQSQQPDLDPAPAPTVSAQPRTSSFRNRTSRRSAPAFRLFPQIKLRTAAATGSANLRREASQSVAHREANPQVENDIRTSSFRKLPTQFPQVIRSTNTPTKKAAPVLSPQLLRKKAGTGSSGGITAETASSGNEQANKSTENRKRRPASPCRGPNLGSTQPELLMLAVALTVPSSSTSPIAPSLSPQPQPTETENITTTTEVVTPGKKPTRSSAKITPLSQQRFFRRRSLRTTPTTPSEVPPALPILNLADYLSTVEPGTENKDTAPNSTGTRASLHSRLFRKRCLRATPSARDLQPLPKVGQGVRFSLEDSDTSSTEPRKAHSSNVTTHTSLRFFKRHSYLRHSSTQSRKQTCEEALWSAPLHVFEPLPRRLSVPEVEAVNNLNGMAPVSMGSKLHSRFFKKQPLVATPRPPLRAPPVLPPRDESRPSNSQTSANGTAGEDEITVVKDNVNEKEDGAVTGTVESGLQYTRDSKRLITYLIPLPMPILKTGAVDEEDIPQRFLIYTPPAPHLLKPTPVAGETVRKRNQVKRIRREGKRHWAKRKMQEEVRKAQTYDGKTVSVKGIHSKVTKGVVWGVRRIRTTDIVFLNRIDRKEVQEIHLFHPPTGSPTPQLRAELLTQIALSKRRAFKHMLLSIFLLPLTLIIDTLAIPIWPFGGLFEVDAIWAYSSIKGWHTSRSLIRRLQPRTSMLGRFAGSEEELRLTFESSEELKFLERYVAEWCHKVDPARFPSMGVPPSEGEVERAVGWVPAVRDTANANKSNSGAAKGKEKVAINSGDEEVQKMAFRDDLKATVESGARRWRKSCIKYEKRAENAATRWPSCS